MARYFPYNGDTLRLRPFPPRAVVRRTVVSWSPSLTLRARNAVVNRRLLKTGKSARPTHWQSQWVG